MHTKRGEAVKKGGKWCGAFRCAGVRREQWGRGLAIIGNVVGRNFDVEQWRYVGAEGIQLEPAAIYKAIQTSPSPLRYATRDSS